MLRILSERVSFKGVLSDLWIFIVAKPNVINGFTFYDFIMEGIFLDFSHGLNRRASGWDRLKTSKYTLASNTQWIPDEGKCLRILAAGAYPTSSSQGPFDRFPAPRNKTVDSNITRDLISSVLSKHWSDIFKVHLKLQLNIVFDRGVFTKSAPTHASTNVLY